MKILFVWTGITRCAGDCWRALMSLPGVSLRVVIDAPRDETLAREILHDIDFTWADGRMSPGVERPDVLFAVGWRSRVVRSFVERRDWREVPKVLCFDMPWRWSVRCLAARFALWRYCRRFRAAYVPGASAARYARWLGFRRIREGFLAIDVMRFAAAAETSASLRKGFLYVGRKSPEKRLDLIGLAYSRYRLLGGSWGIECHHSTPYADLPSVYARSACLVLASERDAWPLVALEAKAAGCEVIMSDRCGNRFELDAHVVRFGDVEAMAQEMLRVERECNDEKRKCKSADDVLERYDCREWAERTLALATELTGEGGLK